MIFSEFNLLKEAIYETSQRKMVVYIPDGGNWGDALIRAGTLKFFRDNSIHYTEISFHNLFRRDIIKSNVIRNLIKDKLLIFGGGGAWWEVFNSGAIFVDRFHHYFENVIVLPSTYNMRLQTKNTTFFSRDRYDSQKIIPEAIFCHDMAFYLGKFPKKKNRITKTGYFFRTDQESSNKWSIPGSNIDISLLGNEMTPIRSFIATIDEYNIIHTDRTHVAISAYLLDKELHFYSAKYFKNEAIYLSSMKSKFDNVTFYK